MLQKHEGFFANREPSAGDRFRHDANFVRWRPDKQAAACTYAQCEVAPPYELARVFSAERVRPASA